MRIVLFDRPEDRLRLYPMTLTRPISHLRVGVLSIKEKWQHHFPDAVIETHTEDYLSKKYGQPDTSISALWIDASLIPESGLIEEVLKLENDQALSHDGEIVAFHGLNRKDKFQKVSETDSQLKKISRTWDLFGMNGQEIRNDFFRITKGRKSQKLEDPHTIVYGDNLFIEEGAKVRAAVINTETGPVYIGKDAEVQEGSLIRGPFALCDHSVINMGAKLKGDTTIGPWSKVGGEISNSIIFGYSNKAHDGFLGNAVIGEWCNLGADTNNSNLKNNYGSVKMWDQETVAALDTGLQFCGLIMGDHSKAGINTMFNTGTTVGVSANVFGEGFPPTHIPSFAWGGKEGLSIYQKDKAFETASKVMERRKLSLTDEDKAILSHIFEHFSPNL